MKRLAWMIGIALVTAPAWAQTPPPAQPGMLGMAGAPGGTSGALANALKPNPDMPGAAPAVGATEAATPVPSSPAGELYALAGNKNYAEWKQSLLFPPDDAARLQHVLDLVAAGKTDEAMTEAGVGQESNDPLDALTSAVSSDKPVKTVMPPEVPIFYLSSVMYHSDDDWVVWMNGQRFTPGRTVAPEKGLEVTSVSPNSASFSWGPVQFEKVQLKLSTAIDSPAPPGSLGVAGRINIDSQTRRVAFTLTPNQTFYTLVPTISEGLPFRTKAGERSLPSTTQLGAVAPPGTPFIVRKPIPVADNGANGGAASTQPNMAGVPLEAVPLPKDPGYKDIQGMLDRSDKIKAQKAQTPAK